MRNSRSSGGSNLAIVVSATDATSTNYPVPSSLGVHTDLGYSGVSVGGVWDGLFTYTGSTGEAGQEDPIADVAITDLQGMVAVKTHRIFTCNNQNIWSWVPHDGYTASRHKTGGAYNTDWYPLNALGAAPTPEVGRRRGQVESPVRIENANLDTAGNRLPPRHEDQRRRRSAGKSETGRSLGSTDTPSKKRIPHYLGIGRTLRTPRERPTGASPGPIVAQRGPRKSAA